MAADIPILSGIAQIADRYEGLVLDLWGVIHDGRTPYPGVTETLARLRQVGVKVVMLSNAPRRASAVMEGMTAMGIGRELYDDVLSSGEIAWLALKRRTDAALRGFGRRCLHIGPERDRGLLDGLDLEPVESPEAGAFILNTGPWQDDEKVADYEEVLGASAGAGMPMICANPDMEVIRAGRRIICAGTLAQYYETLGGTVIYFGKPYAEAYLACLELLDISDRSRLLAIGDSLATDIRGAAAAGIDAVLVTSGIHGDALGLAHGEPPDPEKLAAMCESAGLVPIAAIPAFLW
jgi:HAD superfamily hydrolase (TIGR01459 family)